MAAGTMALSTSIDQTKAINPWLIAITVTLATFMELLPVRIRFDRDQDPQHLLRPGMSVEPRVRVR